MIKYLCDKCGKEVSVSAWKVRCDALNSETHFSFEICSECMLKLRTLLDSKAESEDVVVTNKNLCDSCVTKDCIFQSGIVRNRCDFYKTESEEKE